MRQSLKKMTSVAVFLLLYYIYMNSIRKVMIPKSGIVVPAILMFTVFVSYFQHTKGIYIKNKFDRLQCVFWVMIAIWILFDNTDIRKGLLENGMIQLYAMIFFLLFANRYNEWLDTWIKSTCFFVMIHAISTVVFFFVPALYERFAVLFFSGDTLSDLLRFYRKGWMSGLCTHFSSNGMILAIGLIVFFEYARWQRSYGRTKKLYLLYFCIVTVLYALILSSKRSPLIAAFIAIAITYIFAEGKDVPKRLAMLLIACVVIYLLYVALVDKIPGLATITDKFNSLEESDVGVMNGREHRWALAVDMFKSSPVFGKGYGSYAIFSANAGEKTSAHNYYLSILAELGITGLIMFIGAFAFGIANAIYLLKNCVNRYNRMIICISLEIQLFVLMYCMTATALMYYYILIPYFLACTAIRCPLEEAYSE